MTNVLVDILQNFAKIGGSFEKDIFKELTVSTEIII